MKDHPGFRLIKEAFDKMISQYKPEDVGGRAVRSAAAGGKAAVERGLQEFPKDYVRQSVQAVYDFVQSQEVADGVSMTIQSFDEEKVMAIVNTALEPFRDLDKLTLLVASYRRTPAEKLAEIEEMMKGKSRVEQFIVGLILDKIKPALEESAQLTPNDYVDQIQALLESALKDKAFFIAPIMSELRLVSQGWKDMSDEEVAQQIKEYVEAIPAENLAIYAATFTQFATPERISKMAHGYVGSRPSAAAIADAVHGVGEEAGKSLDRASKIKSLSDLKGVASDFFRDAAARVQNVLTADKKAKTTFPKGGRRQRLED